MRRLIFGVRPIPGRTSGPSRASGPGGTGTAIATAAVRIIHCRNGRHQTMST